MPIANKHPWIKTLFSRYNERIKRLLPITVQDFSIELPFYVPAMIPVEKLRFRYGNHFNYIDLRKKRK